MKKQKPQTEKSKPLQKEIFYLLESLSVFYTLRKENVVDFRRHAHRLIRETSLFHKDLGNMSSPIKVNFLLTLLSWISGATKRFFKKLNNAFFILRLLPRFIAQKNRLENKHRELHTTSNVIIGTASNRLNSLKNQINPRKFLSLLARSFLTEYNQPDLEKQINTATYLYVCDPLLISPLWEQYKACLQENVFIFDTSFLIFFWITTFFRTKTRYFWQMIKNWKFYFKLKPKDTFLHIFKKISATAFFTEVYAQAFYNIQTSCLLFTSNSFATEILRLYLLQDEYCSSICEIMHGASSTVYERYVLNMLEVGFRYKYPVYEKHSSLSNIPMIPMFGVLKKDVKYDKRMAINTYFNKYILQNTQDHATLIAYLESEYVRFFEPRVTDLNNPLIISFIGSSYLEKGEDYLNSDIFKVECFMMQQIRKIFASMNRSFLIIYTPHPLQSFTSFMAHPFFKNNDIALYKDTIYLWFIADMSFSLFSSAIFEAVYFGIKAFLPMQIEDDIYPLELLETLTYQKDKTTPLEGQIRNFILSYGNPTYLNIKTKIKLRASSLHHCHLQQADHIQQTILS